MNTEKTKRKNIVWQVQEAKAMFSEAVKSSLKEPQIITVHGKKTAVILSYEEYKRLSSPKQSLYQFIQSSPLYCTELELPPRLPEETREVNL